MEGRSCILLVFCSLLLIVRSCASQVFVDSDGKNELRRFGFNSQHLEFPPNTVGSFVNLWTDPLFIVNGAFEDSETGSVILSSVGIIYKDGTRVVVGLKNTTDSAGALEVNVNNSNLPTEVLTTLRLEYDERRFVVKFTRYVEPRQLENLVVATPFVAVAIGLEQLDGIATLTVRVQVRKLVVGLLCAQGILGSTLKPAIDSLGSAFDTKVQEQLTSSIPIVSGVLESNFEGSVFGKRWMSESDEQTVESRQFGIVGTVDVYHFNAAVVTEPMLVNVAINANQEMSATERMWKDIASRQDATPGLNFRLGLSDIRVKVISQDDTESAASN